MPRATPLAQDESISSRSTQPAGPRPALVLIRCNPRHANADVPKPTLRLLQHEGDRQPSPTPQSVALQQFAQAAERRRSSMDRFAAVAGRMASQAEHLAAELRNLRFAGSTS